MSDTTASAGTTPSESLRARLGRLRLRNFETEPWVGLVIAIAAWALIVVLQRAVGPPLGHRPGRPLLLPGDARRPVPPLATGTTRSPTSTRRRSSSSSRRSPQLPWQAFMAAWTALLHRRRPLPDRAAPARGRPALPVHRDGDRRRQRLAAPRGRDRRSGSAGRPTWSLVLLTKITPGIGLLWFAVRRRVALARDRPRRDGRDRRGLVRDRCPTSGANGSTSSVGNVAAGKSGTWASLPVPLLDPPADRRRARRLGRPDGPGAGRCRSPRCSPCRRSGTAASRCCSR